MEKKNENISCEVIQDLVPLYVDGACSKASAKLVEDHIEKCSVCREIKELMETPLPVSELPEKDIKVKKAFVKIWKQILAASLAVVLLIIGIRPVFNEIEGRGLTIKNRTYVKQATKIMDAWIESGYESAVDEMEPKNLYDYLSIPLSGGTLSTYYGDGFSEFPEFEPIEIDGQIYYSSFDDYPWEEPVKESHIAMKEALEAEDYTSFWYSMLTEYTSNIVVSETVYQKVAAKYEDFPTECYHSFEWKGKTYYYYQKALENGISGTITTYYDFPEDMYEHVDSIYALDKEYFFYRQANFMPEPLYQEFISTYSKVTAWYEEYAAYYKNMGYKNFKEQWCENFKNIMADLESQNIYLEDYSVDYKNDIWRADTELAAGWDIRFLITFSNGYSGYIYFNIEDGYCYVYEFGPCYGNMSTQAEIKLQEEFFDQLKCIRSTMLPTK